MRFSRNVSFYLSLFSLFFSSLALAGPGGEPGRHGGGMGRMARELNLTPEQHESLRALRQKNMPRMMELRAQLERLHRDLAKLFAEGGNAADIRAKNGEMAQLRKQLDELSAENLAELARILTPEQRTRFASGMAARGPDHRPWLMNSPTPQP